MTSKSQTQLWFIFVTVEAPLSRRRWHRRFVETFIFAAYFFFLVRFHLVTRVQSSRPCSSNFEKRIFHLLLNEPTQLVAQLSRSLNQPELCENAL